MRRHKEMLRLKTDPPRGLRAHFRIPNLPFTKRLHGLFSNLFFHVAVTGEKWKRVISLTLAFLARAPASLAVRWHFVFAFPCLFPETPPPQKVVRITGEFHCLLDVLRTSQKVRQIGHLLAWRDPGDLSCEFTQRECFFSRNFAFLLPGD